MTGTYRRVVAFVGLLTRLFFRRVEVVGLEHVPASGGGLVVSWHPNGLIDPALILSALPRRLVFGARHGLFKWPLLGPLMRSLGTVPIYRAQDGQGGGGEEARRVANDQSLSALADAICGGSFSALFPEGISHDASQIQQLKTGAARLYERALAQTPEGHAPPVILPVGLHYDDKAVFRSNAVVAFHAPIELPAELSQPLPEEADPDARRAHYRAITDHVEARLVQAVHPTENWRLNQLIHRTASLVRTERAQRAGAPQAEPELAERTLAFRRVWQGYMARRAVEPVPVQALVDRIDRYDKDLSALGLDDADLDRDPRLLSRWLPLILLMQLALVYLLMPPLIMMGYLINSPVYFGMKLVARKAAALDKDVATIKLLGSFVLYPISWLLAAALVAYGQVSLSDYFPGIPRAPFSAAALTIVFGVLGAATALRYVELVRQTVRAVRVRTTRRRLAWVIDDLRGERSKLTDHLERMAEGLQLSGVVSLDGRVTDSLKAPPATRV